MYRDTEQSHGDYNLDVYQSRDGEWFVDWWWRGDAKVCGQGRARKKADAMRQAKEQIAERVIPPGLYCYGENGVCPYWSKRDDKPEQENGYCSFLEMGDWQLRGGLLWDQVKECAVNMDMAGDE